MQYICVKIHKCKARDSEINVDSLCSGNVLKDFSVYDIKKTELYWYVFDYSADYDSVDVADILDIHKYLMKRRHIK